MSVHCTPDGRYYVRFVKGTIKDRPNLTREYYGKGEDGRAKAHERNSELGFGQIKTSYGKTFAEIAEYYLNSKFGKIEGKSILTANMHLTTHLMPFFGNTHVREITDSMLDQYCTHRASAKWRAGGGNGANKIGVTRSTIRRELGTLQAVLNFATKRKEISYNPVSHYDMPKEDDAIISPATKEEIAAIISVSPPHLRRFLIIAYYTAVRPGNTELLTLKWSQIDFVGKIINIVSARKGGLVARRIAIHPELEHHLDAWYHDDSKMVPVPEHVVHYKGKKILKVDNAWKIAKRKAKVLRRLRLYDIRHASITGMLEAGADLKAVSMAAGHANPAMTMRKYQHVSTRLQEVAINSLVPLVTSVTLENKPKTLEPKPGA